MSHPGSMSTSSSRSSLSSGDHQKADDDEETGEGVMSLEDVDTLLPLNVPSDPPMMTPLVTLPPGLLPSTLHSLPLKTQAMVRRPHYLLLTKLLVKPT